MIHTVPQASYTNAIVVYHWRKSEPCQRFMPLWESIRPQVLSRGINVTEIEVEDHKPRLEQLCVTLGNGVPRILYYNATGENVVHTGERSASAILRGVETHIAPVLSAGAADIPIVSPSFVTTNLPVTVLYFKEKCPFCISFYPEFSEFARSPNVGTVVKVDINVYPDALKNLSASATSPGVPHVVYHGVNGEQMPFNGERTAKALRTFLTRVNERHVTFEAGATLPVRGNTESRLVHALDKIQERASMILGKNYRHTFEPEWSKISFVGLRPHSNINDDRVYILLTPFRKPRGKPPAHACIYGSRSGELTTKIYINKDIDVLLRNKRIAGFEPVLETDPYVNALQKFGYHVELS